MEKLTLSCPCHFGIEKTLKFEASRIGGENITVTDGRVTFEGGMELIPRANLCLATAERVQIQLAKFKAYTFDDLFEGVKAVPLENFIGKQDAFPVKGHSLSSKLSSVPACQSIIKKAAADRLGNAYNVGFMEETGAVHRLQFNILKDEVSLYLDTSGTGLHKRGYRKTSNAAPIKETLAAGIVDIAMVKRDTVFCDPFCGSGTFLIEAAYKALNIAPGLGRTFAAERWKQIPTEIWQQERARAMDSIVRDSDFYAYGYDIDPDSVALAIKNCTAAGVKNRIRIEQADIRSYENKSGTLTVCNPPYGERMLELKEAEELYRTMGRVFLADKEHPCAIISPHEDFEQFFGKQARKRRKLYNGMIKCQLFSY